MRKKEIYPIPKFKSIEEEARFWDTHDFSDYWHQFKPVKVKFAKNAFKQNLVETMAVRLDEETANDLRQEANKKGLAPTTLIRVVLKDYFRGYHGIA